MVKGKDDLRQDAVMQQVFTIINSFLAANKQTKKLLIRTYKVHTVISMKQMKIGCLLLDCAALYEKWCIGMGGEFNSNWRLFSW